MTTEAEAQQHIEDKAEIVLEAYLATLLATKTIPGVSDRLDSLDIRAGVDTTGFPPTMQGDRYPRVEVFVDTADSDNAVLETTTTEWRYTVAGIVQFDGGLVPDCAKAASRLALWAAHVLEKYLPDPSNSSSTPIWDVQFTSPARAASVNLDDGRPTTIRASATVTVFTRVDLEFTPTFAEPTLTPTGQGPIEPLVEANAFVDLTDLGDVGDSRNTTVSISAAQLAGGTNVGVDIRNVIGWPPTSVWEIALTRHNATVSGTTTASNPEVALATFDVIDGDRWVVTCEHADTKQLLTWAITWNVT